MSTAAATQSKPILVVDDDGDILESLREVLHSEGYQVQVAVNGQEARQALKDISKPCLVLLHLMMPIMNGWQFVATMASESHRTDVTVIILSAVGGQISVPRSAGFLKKPVELDDLLAVVAKFCVQT